MSFSALAGDVYSLVEKSGNLDLLAHALAYRAREHENFTIWAMRDDMENAEEACLNTINNLITKAH